MFFSERFCEADWCKFRNKESPLPASLPHRRYWWPQPLHFDFLCGLGLFRAVAVKQSVAPACTTWAGDRRPHLGHLSSRIRSTLDGRGLSELFYLLENTITYWNWIEVRTSWKRKFRAFHETVYTPCNTFDMLLFGCRHLNFRIVEPVSTPPTSNTTFCKMQNTKKEVKNSERREKS